jgi:hypothetical protein
MGFKMEKIVVLKRNNGDDNLVDCLRMLFPECAIEVHEKRPNGKKEYSVSLYNCNKAEKRLN